MSGQSSPRTAGGAPTQPSSKSAAAPAKLSSEVEMDDLPGTAGDGAPKGAANGVAGGPATAPESDIMQPARIGDIAAMEKLFESGEFDATYSDEEGITPLHVGGRCAHGSREAHGGPC